MRSGGGRRVPVLCILRSSVHEHCPVAGGTGGEAISLDDRLTRRAPRHRWRGGEPATLQSSVSFSPSGRGGERTSPAFPGVPFADGARALARSGRFLHRAPSPSERGKSARESVSSVRPLASNGEGHNATWSCSRRRPSPSVARAQRATNVLILLAPSSFGAKARGLGVLFLRDIPRRRGEGTNVRCSCKSPRPLPSARGP